MSKYQTEKSAIKKFLLLGNYQYGKQLPLSALNNLSKKTNQMKITVVGAGAVGATCADNIARKELCEELVLLDIKQGVSEGKAIDIMQSAALLGFDTKIIGTTNDYAKTAEIGRASCREIV